MINLLTAYQYQIKDLDNVSVEQFKVRFKEELETNKEKPK